MTRKKNKVLLIVLGVALALYSLLLILMLYTTVTVSLKSLFEFQTNLFGIPRKPDFSNYKKAFDNMYVTIPWGAYNRNVGLAEMLVNSVLFAVGCAFTSTFVPCVVAYVVAKVNTRFNKVLYAIVTVTLVLQIVGATASEIEVSRTFLLYDSLIGVWILRGSFLGFNFLVFYATFKNLSNSYAEAAYIDGAGYFRVMFGIMIPLVKTTFFAVFLMQFIAFWNDYQTPMLFLPSHPTAAVGLFKFTFASNTNAGSTMPTRMAGCMILFIPIFAVFIAFKNVFIGNLTVGGLKG